ncbi:mitogen-activated protein kinase kinase kinase, partial [Marasmius crinis-equi]
MSAAGARRRLPVVNPGRLHVVNPGSDSDDSDDFRRPRREDTGLSFPWLSSPTNSSADRESPPTPHDPVEPLFLHGQPANRTVKLNPNPPQPFSPPTSTVPTRNGLPRRPSSPPSTISPEQTSTTPSPAYAIADKTLILVTSDSSLYANVEITGATTAAFIREKIFTALNIFDDEDQSRFSIYRTEIGQYAIGDALTDDRLYEICRASGDSKGSLKLLVSHTSATVHDPNYRPPIQPAHSITPP